MTQSTSKRARFYWLLKMALRDGRAGAKKLFLFVSSIILGIAAVVSIQSFGVSLKENIGLQSKALMGADYKISTNEPPREPLLAIIDSLGGAAVREISFPSMVVFPDEKGSRLVQIRGIEKGFPFYGTLETLPENAANSYYSEGKILLDATLMLQMQLAPGDTLKVGELQVPIAGALKSIPGSSAFFSAVAPVAVLPYEMLQATGLLQFGSRLGYDFYFTAADEVDLVQLRNDLRPQLTIENATIQTHISGSEQLGKRYENFGKFLNLVAFIALLLGSVGIASAIHIYIKGKLRGVAILKCLGASKRQTFLIYLLQVAVVGLAAAAVGTFLGLLLQQLFPLFFGELLPVDVQLIVSGDVVVRGLLLGVVMSVLFALHPLMSTLYVSPLQTLRASENFPKQSVVAGLLVLALIVAFVYLFSYSLLEKTRYALFFMLGLIVTFSILAGLAQLFIKAVKSFFPSGWGFVSRQSLLNLFRPQNQTMVLILTIGVGTFLISTLYFTKDVLLAQASVENNAQTPNLILLDVQSKQQEAVTATLLDNDLRVLENMPIVTMRLHAINNKTVNQLRSDSLKQVDRWVLNHEFRVSYRNHLNTAEKIQKGTWDTAVVAGQPIPISISDNLVRDAGLKVGDEVFFNVQGVLVHTQVSSLRLVDWSSMQMNFMVLFPEGVLENAPQFRVITAQTPDEAASASLQRVLVKQFPNITIIDIRQVITVIEDLLSKISWLINFMAFFSILTGFIVLIGAIKNSKYRRIRESVLLRTLGAKSSQLLKMTVLEYFYLGALGAFTGILLSLAASQLLAWLVFDMPFVPTVDPFLLLFPGITLLVVLVGLSNSIAILKSPPLQVLRTEGV